MDTKLNKASIRTGVDLIDRQHFKYLSIVNNIDDTDSSIMTKLKSMLKRFTAKHGEEAEWQ